MRVENLQTYILAVKDCGQDGRIGCLLTPDKKRLLCNTIERPSTISGVKNKSDNPSTVVNDSCCVLEGKYLVTWTYSNRLKRKTFQLEDKNGREGIRIHPANTIDELEGCIAPCKWIQKNVRFKDKIYKFFGVESKKTTEMLESILPKTFILEILSVDVANDNWPVINEIRKLNAS